MIFNRFFISVTAARRLRSITLLLGTGVLFTVWDCGSAWPWCAQSFTVLALTLILYGFLRVIRRLGNLPTLLPEVLANILRSSPRPLIAPTSVVLFTVALLLFLTGLFLYPASFSSGYNLKVYPLESPDVPIYQTTLRNALLRPFDLPSLMTDSSSAVIDLSGYLSFPSSSSYKPTLSAGSGETRLIIDGQEVGRILRSPLDPVTIPTVELSKGWHRVEITHTTHGIAPALELKWSVKSDSDYEPIYLSAVPRLQDCVHSWRHRAVRILSTVFLALGLIGLTSVAFSWISWHTQTLPTLPKILVSLLLALICLVGVGWTRWKLLEHTGAMIEADEAAFGLMAQRLLRGELPPIFHYGQPYQGTAEVLPLAVLFKAFGTSPLTLKLQPWLCYAAFSLLLLFLYRRVCTLTETLVLVAMLVCSPFLLMWISLKAWFGYSETLFSSGVILLSTYKLVYCPGPRDRYWTLLLGLVSGVSLYILPFTLPVVASAVLFLAWCKRKHRRQTLCLAGAITLAIAVPPYVLHDLTTEEKSASFLVSGRELGEPRVAGERPFMDRFLNECLPVILGGRTTYDHQRDLPLGGLPRVLYLITLTGAFLLPADLREDCQRFLRGHPPGRLLFILPAVLAVPVGVFSPFGIWPWYFLPLYVGLPLVWASFLKFSLRHARPIGLAAIPVCLTVWATGSLNRPDLMFQPGSLVQTGVILREDNGPVIDTLLKRGVDHVICDQGADFAPGRDWIGERLTFESGLRITAINPLTRRHPHLFADTKTADRVAYLFRRSFLFWDLGHVNDLGYQAVTFDALARLFGPEYLNYTRVDLDNDVLFIPSPDHPSNGKGLWRVNTSREPWFLDRLHDHSISSRVYGPTYWSSGPPNQRPGDFIEIDIGRITPIRGIVMYHGVKTPDRPRSAEIHVSQDREQWWSMGRTEWDASASVTYWRHTETFFQRYVRIELTEPADAQWTIYELWIF